MIRKPAIAFVAALALLLAAASWQFVTRFAATRDVPIIIYVVDTLRADHLGLYDPSLPHSPHLDALAADSVVFEQAYGPAPWTPPSIASLMTSRHLCEHGVHGGTQGQWLNPRHATFAERLGSIGYLTESYVSNIWVGPVTGLDRGFAGFNNRIDDHARADDVRDFLGRAGDNPFLLYVHTVEPHQPFKTPYPYIREYGFVSIDERKNYHDLWLVYAMARSVERWQKLYGGEMANTGTISDAMGRLGELSDTIDTLYDASVRWADDNLGGVIAELKESGVWDEAIFIFLSDHGEEFFEHEAWFHGQSVYEELIRVPLLMHFPGGEFGGTRIDTPVSLVDVMPTVLDYLGRSELCADCRGASMLDVVRAGDSAGGQPMSIPAMRHNEADYYRFWQEARGDVNVVVRQGDWKGIFNKDLDTLELYDLGEDAVERNDVSAEYADLATRMTELATTWLADCEATFERVERPEVEIDEQTKAVLKAHGYFN